MSVSHSHLLEVQELLKLAALAVYHVDPTRVEVVFQPESYGPEGTSFTVTVRVNLSLEYTHIIRSSGATIGAAFAAARGEVLQALRARHDMVDRATDKTPGQAAELAEIRAALLAAEVSTATVVP